MDKIDPKLLEMIEAHAAGELPVDPENPDFLVHVYVAVENDDFGGVVAAGHEVASHMGGSGIITLPISEIESLADRADVLAIFAARSGQPLNGPPVKLTINQSQIRLQEGYQVTSRNRPSGSHGEGVIIGIVDSGVNILHDAFTFSAIENGKKVRKTRILHYWAQGATSTPGSTPIWERNGTVFSKDAINAHIAAFDSSGTMPPAKLLDKGEHGTGVASVAGGSAWTSGLDAKLSRTGIAPAARFIVVSGQEDDLAGIEFCFTKAATIPEPCVVNMSLGDHDQPHNGLTVFGRRLRELLTQGSPPTFRPGRAFVVAAGNEGVFHNHLRLNLSKAKTIEIHVDPKESGLGCVISSTKPGLKVTLALPAAAPGSSAVGPKAAATSISGHTVTIRTLPSLPQKNPNDLPADPDFHIDVRAKKPDFSDIKHGIWQLRLDPGADPHPEVHIWSFRGTKGDTQKLADPIFGFGWAMEDDGRRMEPRWRREKEWIHNTLTAEACCRDGIPTGSAMWLTDENIMIPHRPSSRGPATETGRPADNRKPDLVAPGYEIVTARWRAGKSPTDQTSISRIESGTSYAAPAVAGAIALMLSHDPTLKQDEIRTILRDSTSPWAPLFVQKGFGELEIDEHNACGKGLVNIEKALIRVKGRVGP